MGDEPFAALVAAARDGDEGALTSLYRRLQPSLLGYLRSQRPSDAEDLAAETWIAAARGLRRFQGDEDDFRRWIFTIARRRLLDLLRAEGRRPHAVAAEVTMSAPSAEDEALQSLDTRRALESLRSLPPAEAEVVVLRVIAGLSAQDVADITGRTPVSVRVLQHRALRRLSELLGVVTLSGPPAM